MSSGLQKEREIVLPPIFVSGTQVRLMSRVCLWYRLFKMKDEGLWRGSSHSLPLIYTHAHKQEHTHSGCPSFVNSQGYFVCNKKKKYLINMVIPSWTRARKIEQRWKLLVKVWLPGKHTMIFMDPKLLRKFQRWRMFVFSWKMCNQGSNKSRDMTVDEPLHTRETHYCNTDVENDFYVALYCHLYYE